MGKGALEGDRTVALNKNRQALELHYYFFVHQHKAAGVKTKQMLNNGCNDLLLSYIL